MLQAGGAGLAVGLAGCSSVRGLWSDPTELLITIWNQDRTQSHEALLEVIEADADTIEDGQVLHKKFTLTEGPERGEEVDEGYKKKTRIESRPYLVRASLLGEGYTLTTGHYHFRPCGNEDLDRLFSHFVPEEASDEFSVRFESPHCK